MKLPLNHISLTSASEVKEICQPLFDLTSISDFFYFRVYNDGSRINLSTRPDWTQYVYQMDYSSITNFDVKPSSQQADLPKSGVFLWSGLGETLPSRHLKNAYEDKLRDARNNFNIDNGLAVIQDGDGFQDFFNFGSTRSHPGVVNYYFNHLDYLKRFIRYFANKAKLLIDNSLEKKIVLPKVVSLTINGTKGLFVKKEQHSSFIDGTEIGKHLVSLGENSEVSLSSRQAECMYYKYRGRSASQTANILNISVRTVEEHLKIANKKIDELLLDNTQLDKLIEYLNDYFICGIYN
jgi:DNA-binding CsgD family transcriptional regulator